MKGGGFETSSKFATIVGMKLQTSTWVIIGLTIVLIVGVPIFYFSFNGAQSGPGKYDTFAQCIADSQATFYGAFWCPHCQAQKKIFGKSAKLLPYVECSMPDQKTLTPICKEKDVKSFPTWAFADGTRQEGEMTFVQLAEKTKCALPESV